MASVQETPHRAVAEVLMRACHLGEVINQQTLFVQHDVILAFRRLHRLVAKIRGDDRQGAFVVP